MTPRSGLREHNPVAAILKQPSMKSLEEYAVVTPKGNSNVTKKGTKQRSFNLDDATFAIVEAEAARLHITNSAALSAILNDWDDETPTKVVREIIQDAQTGEPPEARIQGRDLSHLLPSETASTFTVNDPNNDPRASGKPRVDRARNKLDSKLSDDSDVVRKKRRDDTDILEER